MRRILKIFMSIIFIISAPISIYSNYWLYTNKTNPISISIKENIDDNKLQVVHGDSIVTNGDNNLDQSTIQEGFSDISQVINSEKNIDYTGNSLNNISSPKNISEIRANSEEPLLLRGYLVVPSVGIKERIMEGLGESSLTYGVGTMTPSSHPSQYGTYSLAGHNFGDWDYGTGLSKLQKYGSSLVGQLAYITYGDVVYEYKFVDVKQMFRDYSMPYTETDWNSRNLSGIVPQYTDDYQVISGSQSLRPRDFYSNSDVNKNMNYNYGKLLTLYTCHVLPPDYRFSYDRIIARAIQINSYNINEAPLEIKNELLANDYNKKDDNNYLANIINPFIITAHAESNKTFTQVKLDNINLNDEGIEPLLVIKEESGLNKLINEQLSKNPKFMESVSLSSTFITTISFVLMILIPWRSKNNE